MKKNVKKTNIKGVSGKERIAVFRSNKNIFAQIIDDTNGITLVSSSSLKLKNGQNVEGAKIVGKELAEKAKSKKIKKVVFDRGRYRYLGRVKAFAEAAREGGLEF
jgi:large subunit ribosomal protein L18